MLRVCAAWTSGRDRSRSPALRARSGGVATGLDWPDHSCLELEHVDSAQGPLKTLPTWP
jgi:hypothetical protein